MNSIQQSCYPLFENLATFTLLRSTNCHIVQM
jgi:hypothetical protein